jgi:hypothetical protein
MFNSPNAIPTKALKDLYTIVGDNMIKAIGFYHIHCRWLVNCSHFIGHFQMKKVHLIMSMWICSNPGGRYALCLVGPNIYSPSKCGVIIERPKLEVYLAT